MHPDKARLSADATASPGVCSSSSVRQRSRSWQPQDALLFKNDSSAEAPDRNLLCETRCVNADSMWASLAAVRFGDSAVEAAVEDRLIRPLIRALGWHEDCVHTKVKAEHRLGRRAQPGRKPEADYVLGNPTAGHLPPDRGYVVIETKRPGEDFAEASGQAESYSFALRALLFMVCDGRHIQVWRTGWADDTKLIVDTSVEDLQSSRAELERHLSPRAAREYHEQQKLRQSEATTTWRATSNTFAPARQLCLPFHARRA